MLESFLFMPELQFGSNCYVLRCADEYAVIDPSVSYGTVAERFGDISEKLRYIILTHSHFDHMLSLEEWIENTSLTPSMSQAASENIKDSKKNCYRQFFGVDRVYSGKCNVLSGGDVLPLGDEELRVIETPGHTSGSICLLTDGQMFVGDTLFAGGSYGRYDLPTGNPALLSDSISRILEYPDGIILMPGHGESASIKEAKKYSYI